MTTVGKNETRTPILLVTFLLLAGLGSANASGDPLGDAFTKELKALAGTWRPISAENNGYKASEEDLKGTLWIRDADGKWTMRRGDKTVVEWAVKKIDATKNPKTIDIETMAGAYKGVVYLGIYELDGDTLRICFALPDRAVRPTEFSASKGTIRALTEFKSRQASGDSAKGGKSHEATRACEIPLPLQAVAGKGKFVGAFRDAEEGKRRDLPGRQVLSA
ncbi:MAG: TIGR03067 domain-containing protein, partial [Thermoanaerobaculia bacterium]